MSVQEAAGNSTSPYFQRLFASEVLGRLPTTGSERVRRTMVGLIGTHDYSLFLFPTNWNLMQVHTRLGSRFQLTIDISSIL